MTLVTVVRNQSLDREMLHPVINFVGYNLLIGYNARPMKFCLNLQMHLGGIFAHELPQLSNGIIERFSLHFHSS